MQRRTVSHTAWLATAALGLVLEATGCSPREAEAAPLDVEPKVSVPITKVVAQKVPKSLVLTGTLVANRESDVAADSMGKVVATYAERGERIRKGQPIARLDASAAALNRAEAQARVAGARVEQAHAKLECERAEQLIAQNVISRSDYDRMKAGCGSADSASAAASARERMAAKSFGDATIRAPFSGVVVERYVTPGEYVQPGARIVTLVDLDSLRLEIAVPESAIASIRATQSVRFEVNAYPGEAFSGSVRYVGPALRRAGRDLVIEATAENTGEKLRPGMFATARIEVGSSLMPVVPASALSGSGRSRRAFVVREQRLEERVVLVGEPVGSGFSVLSGLVAGEQVAGRSGPDVKDGARIQ